MVKHHRTTLSTAALVAGALLLAGTAFAAPAATAATPAQPGLYGSGDPTYDGAFRQSLALLAHEAAGTTDSPEYEAAMSVFYQRHVCRLDPMPEPVQRSFAKLAANPEVYHTMNGPSEFHVVGTLKTWDVCDRLGEITIPTLVTSGRFDEATLRIAETVTHGIPGAQWVVFEESSHMAHAEQPEAYIEVLDAFLGQVEEAVAQA